MPRRWSLTCVDEALTACHRFSSVSFCRLCTHQCAQDALRDVQPNPVLRRVAELYAGHQLLCLGRLENLVEGLFSLGLGHRDPVATPTIPRVRLPRSRVVRIEGALPG